MSDISRRTFVALTAGAAGNVLVPAPSHAHPDPLDEAKGKSHEIAALLNANHPGEWVVSFCPDSDFVLIHRAPH